MVANLPLPRPNFRKNQTDGAPAVVADNNKPADGGRQMTAWEQLLAGAKASQNELKLASATPAPSNLPAGRVAPPLPAGTTVAQAPVVEPIKVPTPQPADRPAPPTPTTPTVDSKTEVLAEAKKAPPDRQPAPKEYVVQKGDNLRKIAKDTYGVTSTKAVEFLLASNKSKIKDKDTIIEGQKLTIPPLPPEMFEGAGNIDVSGAGPAIRTVTSEELSQALSRSSDRQRMAPVLVKKDLSAQPSTAPADPKLNVLVRQDRTDPVIEKPDRPDKPEKVASAGNKPGKPARSGYRMYEVKTGDTPRSISARELGSVNHWNEIIKLNPSLDPKKMKPGTKIKVPDRKPLASRGGAKLVSA